MPNQAQFPITRQPAPQPIVQQQPAKWQSAPVSAAATLPPAKVRGVMADQAPKFALPSPAALGVSDVNVAQPNAAKSAIDWKQVQARMERLNVLRYQKDRLPSGGVQVTMLLPTSDPARGQPVTAEADTEATAIVMALEAAEAWQKK